MESIDLGGNWELLRLSDGSSRPLTLPGDILSALLAAGEIPDPFFGRNELELQWIGREDWLLYRDFEAPPSLLRRKSVFLELEAIDTFAEIRLNGFLLGKSENSFTRFRAEAGPALEEGSNRLEILIRSPERAAEEAAAALPYPVPESTYSVSSPHRNLNRKIQCMSGWDWGPCLMTGGVYDRLALVGIDGPRIEYATTRARRLGPGAWSLGIELELLAPEAGPARLEASIAGRGAELLVELPAGPSSRSLSLELRGIEDWWPAGYGKQPLYELRVSASAPSAAGEAGEGGGSHELVKRLGFRELSLVTEEDAEGRSMKFRVNGRDIFAKGANWIPADALPSRWTRARIGGLLDSALAAKMNMLRVWGGGRYESEDFYELCDEKGILVWQDCAFSCALYPSDPAFLGGVEAEIRHQVRRLRDHPSLALWCGNNEALGAITWYEESRKNPARYIVDYDRLTEGVLGRVIRALDPGRSFWPSSPSAGPGDFTDNWHADGRGDMHFWSVWHEGKPFSAYLEVKPRFCSEFGFQALPSMRAAKSFAPPGELNLTSPAFEHHQRHPRGNSLILETLTRYFRMPRGFRELLWLSEVQQALAIKTAVEYWRSLRPRCMGTLYWQLNEAWPGASWASLEHDGSWRLLHYEAARFYDPVLLALFAKDGSLHAVGVNDTERSLHGELDLCLRRFDGSLLMDISTDGDLPPESATLLWKAPLASLPGRPEEVYLAAHLEADPAHRPAGSPGYVSGVPSVSGGRASVIRRSQLFLAEPKKCGLAEPHIAASVEEDELGLFLALRAEAPAFWVTAEAEGIPGRFEDAGFYLLGGEERKLRFLPAPGSPPPQPAALRSALRLLDLRGSYD